MILRTLSFEARLLCRDRGFLLMALLLVVLVGLANLNGHRQWELRQENITRKQAQRTEADAAMIELANRLASGEEVKVGFYDNPTNPMGIGWKQPRLAAYEPGPMSMIATGHSDIFQHTSEVSVYGEQAYQANFKEMRSPLQQVLGFFDLSLVLVFLFPLFVLAISYNLVSEDRERGSLSLLLAQGVAVRQWLFARIFVRYVFTTTILGVSVLVSLGFLGVLGNLSLSSLIWMGAITALYGALWFTVSYGINLRRGGSARHGFALVVLWAAAVLVIPGGLNQLARVAYPMPSRVSQVNAMRVAVAEAEEANTKTFQQFYQKHPDLKPEGDVGRDSGRGWFMNYFAIQAEAWRAIQPMLEEFDAQLGKRNRLIDILGGLSPSIPYASSLDQVAGTSPAHYRSWQQQVANFSQTWKDYVFPKVFHDQWLEVKDLENLPSFTFNHDQVPTNLPLQFLIMLCQGLVLVAWARMANPRDIHASE